MTLRRVFLLFVVYLAVDFADPVTVSPISWKVEDGEEEAIEVAQRRFGKRERINRESPPPDNRAEVRERIRVLPIPVPTSFRPATRVWVVPLGRRSLPASPPATAPEDH